jgi:hypothetical protein
MSGIELDGGPVMGVVFVTMVCAAVALPFIAMAWALKRRECPHCGASIDADPLLVHLLTGE